MKKKTGNHEEYRSTKKEVLYEISRERKMKAKPIHEYKKNVSISVHKFLSKIEMSLEIMIRERPRSIDNSGLLQINRTLRPIMHSRRRIVRIGARTNVFTAASI